MAVAGLLNATLVIPIFHLNSVWRDSRYHFKAQIFKYEKFLPFGGLGLIIVGMRDFICEALARAQPLG